MKNEDINSRIYALIQLSGHSPKTVIDSWFVSMSNLLMEWDCTAAKWDLVEWDMNHFLAY